MGLEQSVVVINEYTIQSPKGGGSRGGTPGAYITDYVCRADATEAISSIQNPQAKELDFIPEIKYKKRKQRVERTNGVAFGNGKVSLSGESVLAIAQRFQNYFDNNKTILKTVISFDEAYLREHGLLDDDFVFQEAGSYRGHLDQLKLRKAIMRGLDWIGKRYYDDLQYIGAIQVDTNHVHCHLAMVDGGRGHIMPDGTQRGKMTARSIQGLRRHIDSYLDEKKHVKSLSASVSLNRQRAVNHVKNLTYKVIEERRFVQMLMAALPKNRNLWRASTNRVEMRKPNAMVRSYVNELLSQPDSGYTTAISSICTYAKHRRKKENLSDSDYRKLIKKGTKDLFDKCVNGVYGMLKQIKPEELVVRSPMLDALSMPYEWSALREDEDPMFKLCFRMRTYGSRLKSHKELYHKYRDECREYDDWVNKTKDSDRLGAYLYFERDYQSMCMTKYQYFMPLLPSDTIDEELKELVRYQKSLYDLQNMRADKSIVHMDAFTAEQYGLQVYGQHGGRYVKQDAWRIDRRINAMQVKFYKKEQDIRDKLFDLGYGYSQEQGVYRRMAYAFDDVKAIDLHHMGYDVSSDKWVDDNSIDLFTRIANRRYDLFLSAREYLLKSGQTESISNLPEADVRLMKDYADRIMYSHVLATERTADIQVQEHRALTVSLNKDYKQDVDLAVRSAVQSVIEL